MKPLHATPKDAPELLTVREVSERLRVSLNSAYQAVRTGGIPGVRRVGRCYRIHRVTFEAWLETGQG